MTIVVVAKNEDGRRLMEHADQGLFYGAIRGICQEDRAQYDSFAILRFIDPYGITVLNSFQQRTFIEELDALSVFYGGDDDWDGNDDVLRVIQTIRDMTLYCQEFPHRYLWFYGD
jgi:hypothetical protein